jgi:hypothetical protein
LGEWRSQDAPFLMRAVFVPSESPQANATPSLL